MKIFCVGSKKLFEKFVAGAKDCADRIYIGESITEQISPCDKYLLLGIDLSVISHCIKNNITNVLFYHNAHVVSASDTGLLDKLDKEYKKDGQYRLLKEINIIRMFFDVCGKKTIMSYLPVHVQYESTTFCNSRCIMCDHFISHNREARHLELSSVKSLSSILPYVSMIILHGNGEPLINPQITEILDIYNKYQVSVSLNTNLSYLTDDILFAIKDNCSTIHVSCDGVNKTQYESIRLGLSFDRFTENLKLLQSNCSNVERIMEVVLMRQNIRNAKEFVQFAFEKGFSKVIFNALGCNEWIGNEKDGLSNFTSLAYKCCMEAREEAIRIGIDVVTPFDGIQMPGNDLNDDAAVFTEEYPDLNDSNILHEKYPWYTNTIAVEKIDTASLYSNEKQPAIRGLCEYPVAKTYIDLSGNVSICCPKSRRFIETLSQDLSFEKIWNCKQYQILRESFYSGRLPLLCNDCFLINNDSLSFMALERM